VRRGDQGADCEKGFARDGVPERFKRGARPRSGRVVARVGEFPALCSIIPSDDVDIQQLQAYELCPLEREKPCSYEFLIQKYFLYQKLISSNFSARGTPRA
jgi:hypothetical protein